MLFMTRQSGGFKKLSLGSETLGMPYDGLEEMFEGYFCRHLWQTNSDHVDGGTIDTVKCA